MLFAKKVFGYAKENPATYQNRVTHNNALVQEAQALALIAIAEELAELNTNIKDVSDFKYLDIKLRDD